MSPKEKRRIFWLFMALLVIFVLSGLGTAKAHANWHDLHMHSSDYGWLIHEHIGGKGHQHYVPGATGVHWILYGPSR